MEFFGSIAHSGVLVIVSILQKGCKCCSKEISSENTVGIHKAMYPVLSGYQLRPISPRVLNLELLIRTLS